MTGLAGLFNIDEPVKLKGIYLNLTHGYAEDFLIVKGLVIGLGHRQPDVVPHLFQVGRCRLKVQAVLKDLMLDPHAVEDGNAGADGKRSGGSIGIGVCILVGKAAAEGEVFPGGSVEVGKTAVLRGVQLNLGLTDSQAGLADTDVVLLRPGYAFLQGPGPPGFL